MFTQLDSEIVEDTRQYPVKFTNLSQALKTLATTLLNPPTDKSLVSELETFLTATFSDLPPEKQAVANIFIRDILRVANLLANKTEINKETRDKNIEILFKASACYTELFISPTDSQGHDSVAALQDEMNFILAYSALGGAYKKEDWAVWRSLWLYRTTAPVVTVISKSFGLLGGMLAFLNPAHLPAAAPTDPAMERYSSQAELMLVYSLLPAIVEYTLMNLFKNYAVGKFNSTQAELEQRLTTASSELATSITGIEPVELSSVSVVASKDVDDDSKEDDRSAPEITKTFVMPKGTAIRSELGYVSKIRPGLQTRLIGLGAVDNHDLSLPSTSWGEYLPVINRCAKSPQLTIKNRAAEVDEAATEFLDSDDAAGKYAWYEHIQDIDTGRFQSQNKSAELQKASIESNFFGKLMSGHADKPEIQRHLPTILFLSHQLYNIESLSDKTKGECYLKILNLSEVIAGAVFSDIEDKGLQKNLINYLKHNIIYFAASLAHNSRSIGNKALRQTGYGVFVGVNSFVLKAESQAIVNHFSAGETSIVSMLSEFPIELAAGLLIGTPTLALGILAGMGLHKLARYYDGQPSGVNSVNSDASSMN